MEDKYGLEKWGETALSNGINKNVYTQRRIRGWTEEEAATFPKGTKRIKPKKSKKYYSNYRSEHHAVYKNRDCIFVGTKLQCEKFLGITYRTKKGEYRINSRMIVFDIEMEVS